VGERYARLAARAAGRAGPDRPTRIPQAGRRGLGGPPRARPDRRGGEFDGKGDRKKAGYFILEVVSADPAKWGDNKLLERKEIAPPPLKK
jgi:hypothetical protein